MGPRVHKLPRHMSPCVAPTVYINMSSIETAASVLFHGLCFLIFEVIDNARLNHVKIQPLVDADADDTLFMIFWYLIINMLTSFSEINTNFNWVKAKKTMLVAQKYQNFEVVYEWHESNRVFDTYNFAFPDICLQRD